MNRQIGVALCVLLVLTGFLTPAGASVSTRSGSSSPGAIEVAKTFPPDMASDVAANTPLTVEFQGEVTQAFYQSLSFHLFRGTELIEGELYYNPSARQVMFKADGALAPDQTYTARVNFHDGFGRTVDKAWNFRTASADAAAPAHTVSMSFDGSDNRQTANRPPASLEIVHTSVAQGLLQTNQQIEVTFSEPLDLTSLRDAPVKLLDGQDPAGIDYRLSKDMKTITLVPRNQLNNGRQYQVAIATSLKGSSGASFSRNTLIPFRVGQPGEAIFADVDQHTIEETVAPQNRSNQSPHRTVAQPRPAPAQLGDPFQQSFQNQGNTARLQAPQTQNRPVNIEPLEVVGMNPPHGADVTNLTQPVTLAFSTDVRPETLNEFTFRLEDDFGPVPAKVHYFQDNRQAILTPVGVLDSGRSYRVVLTQGVTDVYGTPIKSGLSTFFNTRSPAAQPAVPEMFARDSHPQFNTPSHEARELEIMGESIGFQSQPDPRRQNPQAQSANRRHPQQQMQQSRQVQQQNPQRRQRRTEAVRPHSDQTRRNHQNPYAALTEFKVSGILPAANAGSVPRDTPILINFSESVDPSSINPINISVFGRQRRIEGRVTYDPKSNRVVFTPNRPLDAKTKYKVIVSDKVQSRSGEALPQYSWEFTTDSERRAPYHPSRTAVEADAAFHIPLIDGKAPPRPISTRSSGVPETGPAFTFVPEKHWAFKTLNNIVRARIIPSFPFQSTSNVTRYEFANVIRTALSNVRGMRNRSDAPRLKVADLIELQYLIIEFRRELKSFGVNSSWFENFLQRQGIAIQELDKRVQAMN